MLSKQFFNAVRNNIFNGQLNDKQVEGLNFLTVKWIEKGDNIYSREFPYFLATIYHETAHTMQPVSEYGGNNYFFDRYDINGSKPHIARSLGNKNDGDGVKFKGRGYVQITGRANYTKFSKILELDLINNPDLTLNQDNAFEVAYYGMWNGTFTGVKYSQCGGSYVKMRRIINGTDKASLIAGYAEVFEAALQVNHLTDNSIDIKIENENRKVSNINKGVTGAGSAIVIGGGASTVNNSSVIINQAGGSPYFALFLGLAIGAALIYTVYSLIKYNKKINKKVKTLKDAKNG